LFKKFFGFIIAALFFRRKAILRKLILALVIFCTSVSTAQNRYDSLVTAGIKYIYNIKFPQAESTFKQVIKEYPKHPAGYFFDAMTVWWKILLNIENEKYDDEFIDKLDYTIDFCDKILEKDPNNADAIFFKGGALGFRGRLYAVRESWLKAALDGKDALPLVKKAYLANPKNIDVQLGFGIYNYLAEVVPANYPFIKPLIAFLPKGNKKKGIDQLNYAATKGKYAKYESIYFLSTIYYTFEHDYTKSMDWVNLLRNEFPDNPRFHILEGRIWVKKNNYAATTNVFIDVLHKHFAGFVGYNEKTKREAFYYIGMNFKNNGIYDSAKVYFENCEQLSKKLDKSGDSGFRINSALFLGNIYDLLGSREKAKKKYNDVLDLDEFGQSHELAERYLKKAYNGNN